MDISTYEISLRSQLIFDHSWWDVIPSTSNTCFVSGPSFSTFSLEATRAGGASPAIPQSQCPPDANQVLSLLSICYPEQDKLLQLYGTKSAFQLLDIFNFSIPWCGMFGVWSPFLQCEGCTDRMHKGRVLLPRSWGIFSSKEGVGPSFFAIENAY